jgi:hypothetical protein
MGCHLHLTPSCILGRLQLTANLHQKKMIEACLAKQEVHSVMTMKHFYLETTGVLIEPVSDGKEFPVSTLKISIF